MSHSYRCAAGLALGLLISSAVAPAYASDPATVDPAALRILKQMTDLLDGLQRFSVNTQNTIEELHPSGHRVDYDLAASVTIKRPNMLRAGRTGELMNQQLYYDGTKLTLYSPVANVYATTPAPATVEKMIDLAREQIGILLPAADLVYRGAYPLLTQDLSVALVVGKAIVGGTRCDQLLFVRPGVQFQVWVEEGKRPWPRKYVVTDTDTPERLSITTVFTDWNDAPAVNDALFAFVPPKGSSATRFLPYGSSTRREGSKP